MSNCPQCNNQMQFVQEYNQWYCHTCQGYQQPAAGAPAAAQQAPAAQPAAAQPVAAEGGYNTEIVHSPSFSALIVKMNHGQSLTAEKGAMMYMHRTIEIQTHGRKGGLMKGLVTSALGGESFFVNTYTATHGPGELALVSPLMGDIKPINIALGGMVLQSGAFLASDPNVNLDTKWQGLRGFLSEKDFVMLHASGNGTCWVSAFGGIIEKDLAAGENISVDTGHLVAFPDTMQFSVRRVGGWKSTLLSGEGLVSDLVGPGKILLQTRHLPGFAQCLIPLLPKS